ncbi:MAG: hydrogenase maturation protease [Nocardioidaceae bacterium]
MSALVVGVGNPARGDDALGPLVAARVARLHLTDVEVAVAEEPLAMLEDLATHQDVVVVDAVRGRRPHPGLVHVVRLGPAPLRSDAAVMGSHGIGVAEVIELARALGRLPQRVTIVGVEAQVCDVGAPLSEQVHAALDDAVRAVLDALPATTRGHRDLGP